MSGFCYVIADGVVFTPDPAGEFWGFRDVPPGEHSIAAGTEWSGPPLSASILVDAGGVVVLRLEDGALVQDAQRAVVNAIARGVITGSLRIELLPFPVATRASDRCARPTRGATGMNGAVEHGEGLHDPMRHAALTSAVTATARGL
eukprot:m51a1_g8600 hypothetical protein (146) ;mRNA; r:153721-157123